MPLKLTGHVTLPEHKGNGGFDHAAVHAASGQVYVAHTANDAVDVIDQDSQAASITTGGSLTFSGNEFSNRYSSVSAARNISIDNIERLAQAVPSR